jgi:hypothetical protein
MLKTIPLRMMARGCAIGILAGLLVVAFESSDFQGKICKYNQATNHEDCPVYSLFPFFLIQISKTLNDYGVAITGIATICLAIITGWLVFVARDQSKTTRAQLRAYLAIERANRQGAHDFGSQFRFNLSFKNCGQTPAYEGTCWAQVQAKECPLTSELTPSVIKTIGRFETPPTNTFHITQCSDEIAGIAADRATDFNDGKIAFYIFGQVDFIDVFGKARWLRFRFRYGADCVASGRLAIEEIKSN